MSPEVAELGLEEVELGAQRGLDEIATQGVILVKQIVQMLLVRCEQ